MNYIHTPTAVVESPALLVGQHIHLPHGTRDARAPPIPGVVGPCNHKLKATD